MIHCVCACRDCAPSGRSVCTSRNSRSTQCITSTTGCVALLRAHSPRPSVAPTQTGDVPASAAQAAAAEDAWWTTDEAEQEDLRIDPSDGLLYCKADFLAEYGGTVQWDAAVRAKPQKDETEEERKEQEQDDDELVPEPEPLPSYPLYVSGSESDEPEPEPEPAAILYGDGGVAYGSDQPSATSAELVQLLTDMGFGKDATQTPRLYKEAIILSDLPRQG